MKVSAKLFLTSMAVTSFISGCMYLEVTNYLTSRFISKGDAILMGAILWSPVLMLLPGIFRVLFNGANIVEMSTEKKLAELRANKQSKD